MPTFETLGSILNRKGHALYSLPPDAPVIDALVLMAEKGVAAVLVISEGVPVGIVSAKDYGRKIVLEGRSSSEVRVEAIMSRSLITVDIDADAALALAIMTQHHIRHLPVMDGGKLAGIVAMGDLARAIIADQAYTIDHLKKYVGHA
jgi:CBS domain-containing protein